MQRRRLSRLLCTAAVLAVCLAATRPPPGVTASTQTDIVGPPGSESFWAQTVLSNGNIVITDPYYDAPGPVADVGAVYLYNGATGALISTLVGSTAGDQVGRSVSVLNDNFIVHSQYWDNPGAASDVGAVTWCSGATGCSGTVSAANSLVGASDNDWVGMYGPWLLSDGDYVVLSYFWDGPGPVADVGAVTWCSGMGGCTGVIGAANSLVGSSQDDQIGIVALSELPSGDYVVSSSTWDGPGSVVDAGAVTWCSGSGGCTGEVSASNSLVGGSAFDRVGLIQILPNGNYYVSSPYWDNGTATDAGAVTWCSGTSGCSGAVSAANSLVGTSPGYRVGGNGITLLSNGNFLIATPSWDAPGSLTHAGAVTWCSGTSGCSGDISAANSLVGSTDLDMVGSAVTALSNGNYVVASWLWDAPGPIVDVGAVTWCSGTSGCVGTVSSGNSLVGSAPTDYVGTGGVVPLSDGDYVVRSTMWDGVVVPPYDAPQNYGAVTWCSGTTGCTGTVSAGNSLVGTLLGNSVGDTGISPLPNGAYVVRSAKWDAPPAGVQNVGAVTWCDGTGSCTGPVSNTNSLVGSFPSDAVGNGTLTILSNGNYVVRSSSWDGVSGTTQNYGAMTWCSGTAPCTGTVSAANSLVGSFPADAVGNGGITQLTNGNYVIRSVSWDGVSGTTAQNFGAATWCSGTAACVGAVSAGNSLVGTLANNSVGGSGVKALPNGNYVVASPGWDAPGPVSNVGAVTWCSGAGGCGGAVNSANSLVGSFPGDSVGGDVIPLPNGSFVVRSLNWDGVTGTTGQRYGAVTWCSGTTTCTGAVSSTNSLVGSAPNDSVGNGGVTQLSNGNLLVASTEWDGVSTPTTGLFYGAITWCSASGGCTGAVSAANSLVGTSPYDRLGGYGPVILASGNYVVASSFWDNGTVVDAGAVTWCSGTSGCKGAVTAANSLVGSTAGDQVGMNGIPLLDNGNYVVFSPFWDNGTITNAGAVTLGFDPSSPCSEGPVVGAVTINNSVLGQTADRGYEMGWGTYDPVHLQLLVGHENIVTMLSADDRDRDCVDDTVEDGAPNSGDGNGDGKLDKTQGHVASLPNDTNGDYLTLVAPSGQQLSEVDALPNPSSGDAPAGMTFPVGFVGFTLAPMPAPPTSVAVSLLFENPAATSQYWRYGPESGDPTDHWYRFDPVGGSPATGATIVSPSRMDFTLVDGARGDDDGAANGTLVDVGGPANVAPSAGAGGTYGGTEGSAIALSGASASDPDGDTLSYGWTVNSTLCTFSSTSVLHPSLTCADDDTFTTTLTVNDGFNPAVTSTADVTVSNVAPALGAISVDHPLVEVDTTVNTSADFTDAGAADTHSGGWDWGDSATSAGTIDEEDGAGTTTGSHSYSIPGVYTVKATVTDDDGAVSNESVYRYVVVYDPDGGFVTGGGWINSPASACPVFCSGATGRANFGFVAKYKKGKSYPEGDTEFQFSAGNLYFESVSYDWLTVAGPHAKFKGAGTINGSGSYQFMLTARDGQISGGGGTDGFRIKIWNGDGVIYDNQWGVSDDSNDTTNIGGGSIVIHRP